MCACASVYNYSRCFSLQPVLPQKSRLLTMAASSLRWLPHLIGPNGWRLKGKLYFNWQQKAICLITTNTSVIKCRPGAKGDPSGATSVPPQGYIYIYMYINTYVYIWNDKCAAFNSSCSLQNTMRKRVSYGNGVADMRFSFLFDTFLLFFLLLLFLFLSTLYNGFPARGTIFG